MCDTFCADKIPMHGVSVSNNRSYRLTRPTLVVSCDLPENRQCVRLPPGATIQLTRAMKVSGVMHIKCGEQVLTMFVQDFQRNTIPIAA
jgi:hypothetical protein